MINGLGSYSWNNGPQTSHSLGEVEHIQEEHLIALVVAVVCYVEIKC